MKHSGFVTGLLIAICLLTAAGCSQPANDPAKQATPAPTNTNVDVKPVRRLADVLSPDVTATVDDLAKDIKGGLKKAEQKYAGKVIRISGRVSVEGSADVTLKGDGDGSDVVVCLSSDKAAFSALKKDQKVVLQGFGDAINVSPVRLTACNVVSAE